MKRLLKNRYDFAAAILLALSMVVMSFAISRMTGSVDMDKMASGITRTIDHKIDVLDSYMHQAMESKHSEWLDLRKLPEDMVIYRYCGDTLQSWAGEFPVTNDDIKRQLYVPAILNPRAYVESPLGDVADSAAFISMGYSWYLVKSLKEGDCKVYGGIEIATDYGSQITHNSDLRLRPGYSIRPVSDGTGVPLVIDGRPCMLLVHDAVAPTPYGGTAYMWCALCLLLCSGFAFLLGKRSLKRMLLTIVLFIPVMLAFYFWGYSLRGQYSVFSPLLYSGGPVLYSLGAVLIVNLSIPLLSACLYITRDALCTRICRSRKAMILSFTLLIASVLLILFGAYRTLESLVENSSINIDLYRISELDLNSLLAYLSLLALLVCIPVLVHVMRPVIFGLCHVRISPFSFGSRILYSLFVAFFLISVSSVLGLRKEQSRMELLAGRLSFDRDIFLELRLRGIEDQIAGDMVIPALAAFNNTASTIQSRIVEGYLFRVERDYVVSVYVFNNENNTRAALEQYNGLLRGAVAIAPNSRFMYVKRDGQRPYYVGLFIYSVEGSGISRVLITLESKEFSGSRGYARIFGIPLQGRETMPKGTSYAHYEGAQLKSSHGSFAYPTALQAALQEQFYSKPSQTLNLGGYTHFITRVADDELVLISRVQMTSAVYLLTALFVAILLFAALSLMCLRGRNVRKFMSSYFRSRILGAMMISLLLTLVAMASVSVYFVNSRNVGNLHVMMSDKINSISTMIGTGLAGVQSMDGVNMMDMRRLLEQVGSDTDSDISLFSSEGRLFLSTTPMIFERQLLGERIDANAYNQIINNHKLYYIQREKAGNVRFYSMYAPVLNSAGEVMAIICSPYSDQNYDFEKDAVTHSMLILALFVFFLTIGLFTVSRMVDTMFRPLDEMSRKMSKPDFENPDYINYERNDEISTIVQSYNRMVKTISDSSRKLAQAERDKAWNEMARQVAHEIKTPLTPMKLQIQRIIRLKEKGDPAWETVFDSASKVLLGHIDILTDTANEFSTFAKLYSEEFTVIDLDAVIAQEMSMFDNKDNISFTYIGFDGATIVGPKPQLTRVIVNLLVNAEQAIGEKDGGSVVVSLRNSRSDGYYDIVFEDNGPGVPEENVGKLFSPNFTTKSGGSGLGLAICRSVLETCGATISYSRSFALGGACFTICYPKTQA